MERKIKGRMVPKKPRLFIIGDAAVDTGFAKVVHSLVEQLYTRWDIDILAINYYGDPHPIQKIANLWCPVGVMKDDVYGHSRIEPLVTQLKPDVLLVINDIWIAGQYAQFLKGLDVKKILYTPVDAKHIKAMYTDEVNKVFNHVVAYTKFGEQELKKSGLKIRTSNIPHGVDKSLFFPLDKAKVREEAGLPVDDFIVQMVDRNQIRKRIDLGLYYFSEWVKRTDKPMSVKFYYHGALIDEGLN